MLFFAICLVINKQFICVHRAACINKQEDSSGNQQQIDSIQQSFLHMQNILTDYRDDAAEKYQQQSADNKTLEFFLQSVMFTLQLLQIIMIKIQWLLFEYLVFILIEGKGYKHGDSQGDDEH